MQSVQYISIVRPNSVATTVVQRHHCIMGRGGRGGREHYVSKSLSAGHGYYLHEEGLDGYRPAVDYQ